MLLLILGLLPDPNPDFPFWGNLPVDKVIHFGVYALWGMVVAKAWTVTIFLASLSGLAASFQEFTQIWVVGRSFEGMDILANLLGLGLGMILVMKVNGHERR
ncbi:MAG: VanZ family protein [Verrucomicrobiota bacterium]